MKPIRIESKNSAAIEAALKAVNGTAYNHCFTAFAEVLAVATDAEERVVGFVGSKARAVGATVGRTSGAAVLNAYANKCFGPRVATRVMLERRSTGWFLIDAKKAEVWQPGGGGGRIALTQSQRDLAVARFEVRFDVVAAEQTV